MADDKLPCRRSELIAATSSDNVMSRRPAISFNPFQNASSRLTLVLWPAITMERLITGDFIARLPCRPGADRDRDGLWRRARPQDCAPPCVRPCLSRLAAARPPCSDRSAVLRALRKLMTSPIPCRLDRLPDLLHSVRVRRYPWLLRQMRPYRGNGFKSWRGYAEIVGNVPEFESIAASDLYEAAEIFQNLASTASPAGSIGKCCMKRDFMVRQII